MSLLTLIVLGVLIALTIIFTKKAYTAQKQVVSLRVKAAMNMNQDLQQEITSAQAMAVKYAKLAGVCFLPILIYLIGTTLISIGVALLIAYIYYRIIRN
jgi:hypothetical protein